MNKKIHIWIPLIGLLLQLSVDHLSAGEVKTLFTSSLHEGNQGYTGPLGRIIDVKVPISITEVGAFESNSTGPFVIKVAIYDNTTKNLAAGSEIYEVNRTNSERQKKYRFTKISKITLQPGSYVLVAQGYNNDQQNGNTGHGGAGPGVHGGDCITVQASLYGEGALSYPTRADGNLYHAANIKFSEGVNTKTPVTRSASSLIQRTN
jgi:hypothetical protein